MKEIFQHPANKGAAITSPGYDVAIELMQRLPNNTPVLVNPYCGMCDLAKGCTLRVTFDRLVNPAIVYVKGECRKT